MSALYLCKHCCRIFLQMSLSRRTWFYPRHLCCKGGTSYLHVYCVVVQRHTRKYVNILLGFTRNLVAWTACAMLPKKCTAGRKIAEQEDQTAAMVILQVPDDLKKKKNKKDVRGVCRELQTGSREFAGKTRIPLCLRSLLGEHTCNACTLFSQPPDPQGRSKPRASSFLKLAWNSTLMLSCCMRSCIPSGFLLHSERAWYGDSCGCDCFVRRSTGRLKGGRMSASIFVSDAASQFALALFVSVTFRNACRPFWTAPRRKTAVCRRCPRGHHRRVVPTDDRQSQSIQPTLNQPWFYCHVHRSTLFILLIDVYSIIYPYIVVSGKRRVSSQGGLNARRNQTMRMSCHRHRRPLSLENCCQINIPSGRNPETLVVQRPSLNMPEVLAGRES